MSGKDGKGITASQQERLDAIKKSFEKKLKKLIPNVNGTISDKQKADLIVQAMVEAGKVLEIINEETADRMQTNSRLVFNSEKIVEAPKVNFDGRAEKSDEVPVWTRDTIFKEKEFKVIWTPRDKSKKPFSREVYIK